MKRSTKGTKMLQAYSWRSSPFEFPHKECHRKARENPWTLEGGRTSESSTVLYPTLWPSPAKDCIARKADPEDPQRSESLAGPRSLWRESRNSGRSSHFFEGKASLSSSGKRVSLFLPPPWGGSSGISNPGVSSKRERNRGGFLSKKPTGESKTPCPEKAQRLRRWYPRGPHRHRYLKSHPLPGKV